MKRELGVMDVEQYLVRKKCSISGGRSSGY